MLSVCITRLYTVMALLLVMSTLSPFLLLLPTVQSSSVAHKIVRHMLHQPSMDSNFSLTASRTLATGLLGESSDGMPPDAQKCRDSLFTNLIVHQFLVDCITIPLFWLKQVELSVGNESLEYKCKDSGSGRYCFNLVGRKYCTPGQFASLHNYLQKYADINARVCKPWPEWTPSLDSPPLITSEVVQCEESIIKNAAEMEKCGEKMGEKAADISNPNERLCKSMYGAKQCYIKKSCKYCESPDKYLDFVARISVWSLGKAECKKWFSAEPKYKCSSFNVLLIVGIILLVVGILMAVISVVVYCLCFASGGSRGGRSNPSSHHSRQPGSYAGAKQSSYA